MEVPSVPFVQIEVNEDDLHSGAIKILEVIRPSWIKDEIEFKLLTDGITNKLIKCKLADAKEEESVLVRVYGNKTDLLIDRKAETRNIILLNKAGLAPNLFATFKNGLAYQFVPGTTLDSVTVAKPEIYKMVATHMAKLHKVKADDGCKIPILWDKTLRFLDLVPEKFTDPKKQERFKTLQLSKSKLLEEIEILKKHLSKLNSPVVFAHNDLLLGNVIKCTEGDSIVFIDYEYAAYNYQAFDIGNHFNEFVGLDTDNIDYSNYPSKDLQMDWLRTYLSEYKNTKNVKEEDVYRLYTQVNKFALASHLFWGIWSLIQAEHSYIDFDFIKYGATRLQEYYKKKQEFLSLDENDFGR